MLKTNKIRIGIIGAGPAGLTAGYYLVKHGYEVDIYEAGDLPGGLSKTITLWNHRVDLGPHRFFSKDDRVNSFWDEIIEDEKILVKRLTRIFYRKKFYKYPVDLIDALKNLGIIESINCLFSYIKEKIYPTKQDGTFENWVVSRFGRRLFEIFFKTYSENLWGISCKELDSKFAQQRIKKLSMAEAIINSLHLNPKNKHRSLIEEFLYPKKGIGQFYEMAVEKIANFGGNIILNSEVKGVVKDGDNVTGILLNSGERVDYDLVISSMPITDLFFSLDDLPEEVSEKLDTFNYRNTILVYFLLDGENYFPDQWIYIHDPGLEFGRLTNSSNWSPYNKVDGETVLIMEYWCNKGDEIWNLEDGDLLKKAKSHLISTGLAEEKFIKEGRVVRINKSYPIYYKGFEDNLKLLQDYADRYLKNLILIGRNGTYKYNNQDHSVLMGILAADNIINNGNNNIWMVNTDDEYQEKNKD